MQLEQRVYNLFKRVEVIDKTCEFFFCFSDGKDVLLNGEIVDPKLLNDPDKLFIIFDRFDPDKDDPCIDRNYKLK